jgi:hypothetical protein
MKGDSNAAARFHDVIDVWRMAVAQNGVTFEMDSAGKAVGVRHRLHSCRSALRQEGRANDLDMFTVLLDGAKVTIRLKAAKVPVARMRGLDGRALTHADLTITSVEDQLAALERAKAGVRLIEDC